MNIQGNADTKFGTTFGFGGFQMEQATSYVVCTKKAAQNTNGRYIAPLSDGEMPCHNVPIEIR
jgi:hypothetical protein